MATAFNADGDSSGSKTTDFTMSPGISYQTDASAGTVDASLPATIKKFDTFPIHNLSASTNQVRVMNPLFTIRGATLTAAPGDNIIIERGTRRVLIATSTTELDIY